MSDGFRKSLVRLRVWLPAAAIAALVVLFRAGVGCGDSGCRGEAGSVIGKNCIPHCTSNADCEEGEVCAPYEDAGQTLHGCTFSCTKSTDDCPCSCEKSFDEGFCRIA